MSTGAFNPNRPIDLAWEDRFGPVSEALCVKLAQPFRSNKHLIARALLFLLTRSGRPTPNDVVNNVYTEDKPHGGWIEFYRAEWLAYIPEVIAALRSDDPIRALGL